MLLFSPNSIAVNFIAFVGIKFPVETIPYLGIQYYKGAILSYSNMEGTTNKVLFLHCIPIGWSALSGKTLF